MRQQLTDKEIIENFSIKEGEEKFLKNKPKENKVVLLSLLKYYELNGKFPPNIHSVPKDAVEYICTQLSVNSDKYYNNYWAPRTIKRYRVLIRSYLNFRKWTENDKLPLKNWLVSTVISTSTNRIRVKDAAYKYLQKEKIEHPSGKVLDTMVSSAIYQWECDILKRITEKLPESVKKNIDLFFDKTCKIENEIDSNFRTLKKSPGRISLEGILSELNKLKVIHQFHVPKDIFNKIPHATLKKYRDRIITEPAREIRRHPGYLKYGMFSIFLYALGRETSDTICDYLLQIIKKISNHSEKRVLKSNPKKAISRDERDAIACKIFQLLVENPDDVIRKIVFASVDETVIRKHIDQYQKNPGYRSRISKSMKASYGSHYRRMLFDLLGNINFKTNNIAYKPIIGAINILKKYLDSSCQYYSLNEKIPVENVIKEDFQDSIYRYDKKGRQRINRVAYEFGVLSNLAEKLAYKGIWVENSDRFRNPDEDTPNDFDKNRENYYKKLNLSQDKEQFVNSLQRTMGERLVKLNKNIPKNKDVKILKKDEGSIKLSLYEKQIEPKNIKWLKKQISEKYNVVSLLDVLKEADLRINFTHHFQTLGQRQIIPKQKLRKRLILDLHAMGTNAGILRIASGSHGEKYANLMYVKRRYITKEAIKAAIVDVVNKTLEERRPDIFGYSTTTVCASDSTQFSAYDQNLLAEWHLRYNGRGVMVYWHIEKGYSCIYSQLKSCSSSEAAAMIEGVIRHSVEMKIEKQFVDTHGQSYVAFAFCHLLGFKLMPRFKSINTKKLYRAYTGTPNAYENLQAVLTRPINWKLIKEQYDEMVKFATAINEGTASSEARLKKFTKNNSSSLVYKALMELGKALRTIFLCNYLDSKKLRIEINEGLNIVELWNEFNDLVFFGKCGEITSNRIESHERSMLCLHLLQNCLVYINTLIIQEILSKPENMKRMKKEDLRALTPLIFKHINPYGNFDLDMKYRIPFISNYNSRAA